MKTKLLEGNSAFKPVRLEIILETPSELAEFYARINVALVDVKNDYPKNFQYTGKCSDKNNELFDILQKEVEKL